LAAAAAVVLVLWAGSTHLQREQTMGRELPSDALVADRVTEEGVTSEESVPTAETAHDEEESVTGGLATAPKVTDNEEPAVGRAEVTETGVDQPAPPPSGETSVARAMSPVEVQPPSPPPVPDAGAAGPARDEAPEGTVDETASGPTIAIEPPMEAISTLGASGGLARSGSGGRGPGGPESPALVDTTGGLMRAADAPQRVAPKYFAPAWVAVADPAGDTPFTVSIFPPSMRVVGQEVSSTIAVEAERHVERARIQVRGSEALELRNVPEDGTIYRGPLVGNQVTERPVHMVANQAGRQSLLLNLRSSNPEVETDLEVDLGEFHEQVPATEQPISLNLMETPVRVAIDNIVQQSGMQVVVEEGLPDRRVTKDFSGVPAAAALNIVVEDVGWTVHAADEVQMVVPR